jgi:TonB family protein
VRLIGRAVLLVAIAVGSISFAQTDSRSEMSKGNVVVISLFNPTYPPLARQAHISGDVELKVEIRKDGSVESAVVVSGNPMLTQAALNSANRSQFDCRGCEDKVTAYSLTYSFEFVASPDWPCPKTSGVNVTQSRNLITVSAEPALVDPYFAYTTARSAKCLYLWPCDRRWGGKDYYYYRVRSTKCLDLWSCGHRLREPFATCNKLHRSPSY